MIDSVDTNIIIMNFKLGILMYSMQKLLIWLRGAIFSPKLFP